MSSPKRAAKTAPKIAAPKITPRNARGVAAARPLTKPIVKVVDGASAEAMGLAATLDRCIVDGKLDVLTAEALQKLIAAACRVYAARVEAGEQFTPISRNSIAATDVMVTASGMLRAVDLAVFELGMWQSWTGR
jgi:hypothetical protein